MEKEFYTKEERIALDGILLMKERLEHQKRLLLLLDYEMEQIIKPLEEQFAL